jgi:hypothetical protein
MSRIPKNLSKNPKNLYRNPRNPKDAIARMWKISPEPECKEEVNMKTNHRNCQRECTESICGQRRA